jgi:hypothetical protein
MKHRRSEASAMLIERPHVAAPGQTGGCRKNLIVTGKECCMAQMLGVWTVINNPNRTTSQDVNLTVGGTILLTDADVKKLQKGELFKINIKIMDEDTFSDDTVHTDNSFQVGVFDTTPKCFHVGVIVPHQKLNDSEPFWESQSGNL